METSFQNLIRYGLDDDYEIELHTLCQTSEILTDLPATIKIVHVENRANEILSESPIRNVRALIAARGLTYFIKKIFISFAFRLKKNFVRLLADYMFPDKAVCTCDICFVLKENEPTLYYALSRVKSKKTICFFHTARYLADEYIDLYQSKAVDNLITVSEGNRAFLCGKMPKAESKTEVIHNIVQPDAIANTAAEFEAPELNRKDFNLISVCRVNAEKGVDTIIAAARRLNHAGVSFKWHIIGPFDKGFTKEYWVEKSEEAGTRDCIVFAGPRNNPYPYIKAADLLVNASRIESFGMVIREAQILGTPVISTDTYGGEELIKDRITGILVPVDDHARLAEEIQSLIERPDLLSALSANLKNENFNEADMIKKQMRKVMGV